MEFPQLILPQQKARTTPQRKLMIVQVQQSPSNNGTSYRLTNLRAILIALWAAITFSVMGFIYWHSTDGNSVYFRSNLKPVYELTKLDLMSSTGYELNTFRVATEGHVQTPIEPCNHYTEQELVSEAVAEHSPKISINKNT